MNIFQKISAIMNEVQYIQKDGQIAFGSTKYKAVTEEKVTSIIKPKLVKYGIVIIPISIDERREGNITTLRTTYRVVNSENPDEFFDAVSVGQGSDTQDKGSNKASTGSWKYLLLRLFAIASGEDPDAISSDELDAQQELTDPVVNAGLVKAQIMGMAKNDLERVNVFINKLFATDGTATLDDLSDSQLVQLKTAIAKKVQK